MTFEEWKTEVTEDFRAEGFTVKEHLGFPLVAAPVGLHDGVRLIKFQGRHACDKRIYEEGMLLVPAGSPRE